MTALGLIKIGKKVKVYSENFPSLVKEAKKPASQIIPHIWLPIDYDWSEDLVRH